MERQSLPFSFDCTLKSWRTSDRHSIARARDSRAQETGREGLTKTRASFIEIGVRNPEVGSLEGGAA